MPDVPTVCVGLLGVAAERAAVAQLADLHQGPQGTQSEDSPDSGRSPALTYTVHTVYTYTYTVQCSLVYTVDHGFHLRDHLPAAGAGSDRLHEHQRGSLHTTHQLNIQVR